MTTRQTSPVEPTPPAPGHPAAGTLRPAAAPSPTVARGGEGAQPRICGIDLSLTSTGIAYAERPEREWVSLRTVDTKPGKTLTDQHARLERIAAEVIRTAVTFHGPATLAVIEGPSYGSSGAGTWDRAGLWWLTVNALLREGVPVAVIPPSLLKKYATGSGGGKNATKTAVASAAARRYDRVFATDDEADAFILCAMGLDHLGHPLTSVPKTHRDALDKVTWPALAAPIQEAIA